MFTNGALTTFKEIMNEFFYDWKMTANPQINKDTDGYWINKTSLFQENGEYFLTYETSSYSVSESALKSFQDFYSNLYLSDPEFETVLDFIESEWNDNELKKVSNGFEIGNLKIECNNFKYFLVLSSTRNELTKKTFQKFNNFYELLNKS
jgi:hypothetical protein